MASFIRVNETMATPAMSQENKMSAPLPHVWVGAETGILKALNLVKRTTTNFTDFKTLNKQHEVHAMCWGPHGKEQILLGLRDGTVKQFDVERLGFGETKDYGELGGQYVGMATVDDSIITCLSNGHLTVWRDNEIKTELDLGPDIKKMKQHKVSRNIIASGGKENELKVYDLEKPENPIFLAKNVRPNFLDLRVPVWINDMTFIDGDPSKIVTCTAHHQVRVYDYRTPHRRPVVDVEYGDCPLMAMDVTPDQRSVIVGNAKGRMGKIELRKGQITKAYRGFAGSIRHIECHPTLPLVGSCGLDRFYRVHYIDTGEIENKVYLKSRLNCFLFTDEDHTKDPFLDDETEDRGSPERDEDDQSGDETWTKLEDVRDETEETAKRKKKLEEFRDVKRTK